MTERANMSKPDLLELVGQRAVFGDGGMGTQLMAAGLQPGQPCELWNVDKPDVVADIHRRYREAGCELITTNTFGGTCISLANHNLAERTGELNEAAGKVARQGAGDDAIILADAGPFGGFIEPLGETTLEELVDIFAEQFAALKAGGADVALVETMSDPGELAGAVRAAKQVGNWPVIATYAFQHAGDSFATMMGTSVDTAMKAAIDAGADIIGSNCGTNLSLDDYLRLAGELVKAAGDVPVILQPNAGAPEHRDGKLHHPASPADMAAMVQKYLDAGVRVLGGCCGTTPEHLKAMAEAFQS